MDSGARITTPWWPAAVSALCAMAAVVLAVNDFIAAETSVPLLAIGYTVGAVLTTVFSSTYRGLRNSRRNHPRFKPQPTLDMLARASMWVGVVAGLAIAYLLATELAK